MGSLSNGKGARGPMTADATLSFNIKTRSELFILYSSSIILKICASMTSTDGILAGKYPAKAHARRVVEYLRQNGFQGDGVLYLEAQKTKMIEDNDSEQPFR